MSTASPYDAAYGDWRRDPEAWWATAAEGIAWTRRWDKVFDPAMGAYGQWFAGAELNTCFNAVDRHVAAGRGTQPALIWDSAMTQRIEVLTYADLQSRTAKVAGALAAMGVERGDRVIIYMPMVPEAAISMLACARLGAIHSVVFGGFAAAELATRIDDAKPKVIVSASCGLEPGRVVKYKPLLDAAIALSPHKPDACLILQREQSPCDLTPGRDHDFRDAEAAATPRDCVPVLATDPLYILYTSGTTGRPKGVWTGALPEADAARVWGDEQELWGFGPDDVSLVHGPLAHSGPLRFALSVLLAGGTVLLPGWFDADAIAATVAGQRPTTAFVVPSHVQRLLARPAGAPPSPYRLLVHAGAACPEPLKRAMHAWAGVDRVWEFYGSTEGQFSACSGPEWEARPGTVGRAQVGRTLLVDDDGVIWCAAPAYARFSYWRDPAKTAAAWRDTPHGRAFSVGDLGRLDASGYLYLDGRRDDLVISGGVNVYPAEVESVLLACPGVREVAVFGLPDERWGQRVCAAVVGAATPEQVRAWAAERLAPYKRPKDVYVADDLPHTASGKLRRLDVAAALGLA